MRLLLITSDAVVLAVKGLAQRGAFAPGAALRVERVVLTEELTTGWTAVTARVTVEPAAAVPPAGAAVTR
jgi:hypothetical protein